VRDATKLGWQAEEIKRINVREMKQRGGVGGGGGILPRTRSSVVHPQRSTLRAGGAARERKARRKNVARKARDQEEIRVFRGKVSAVTLRVIGNVRQASLETERDSALLLKVSDLQSGDVNPGSNA